MLDLIPELLPKIQAYRLPDLDLGDGFIYPYYDGLSILNLPTSVCKLLGVPLLGRRPLPEPILAPLGDDINK